MKASIIIPHYNGIVHLQDCFASLRKQQVSAFEILLVDNGSTDGSQAFTRENFPEVKVIELGRNTGFTGACNAGYAASVGEIVILLNNDTEVHPDWLAEVLATFASDERVGVVASKMLLFDQRDVFHTAGDFYRIDGIPGNRGIWQKDDGQYDVPEPVFSACGGSAAYRRTMIEQIGFLDDDFFFSCEDVDLGFRARLRGWEVIYAPTAIVYHKLKATGGGPTASYYDGRNFLYLIWKNYPSTLLRRHWRQLLGAQWHISREAMAAWRGEAARARLKGQLAGLLGIFKMWPKRRVIQANRRLSDDELTALMSPVDASSPER